MEVSLEAWQAWKCWKCWKCWRLQPGCGCSGCWQNQTLVPQQTLQSIRGHWLRLWCRSIQARGWVHFCSRYVRSLLKLKVPANASLIELATSNFKALLNLVENALNISYLALAYKKSPVAVLFGFTGVLFTFWKTWVWFLLFGCQEVPRVALSRSTLSHQSFLLAYGPAMWMVSNVSFPHLLNISNLNTSVF